MIMNENKIDLSKTENQIFELIKEIETEQISNDYISSIREQMLNNLSAQLKKSLHIINEYKLNRVINTELQKIHDNLREKGERA